MQSEDTVLINDLDDEIADDEQDVRKVTDVVKCFAEMHGDKQMNVMLSELIGKVETLKLQNFRQSAVHILFQK